MEQAEFWYRVKEQRYSSCMCEDICSCPTTTRVEVEKFRVVKTTPKGVWLSSGFSTVKEYQILRWVKNDSKKKYACPTVEEAYKSFFRRKERQIKILKSRLNQAEEALEIGKNEFERIKEDK